ncbi:pseudouridine synthase, partial [Pseudovirgaria hyperparasitica]
IIAIHKPPGISSAGLLEVIKKQFNSSKLFAAWLERERDRINKSGDERQRKRWNKSKFRSQVKMGHGGTLDPQATGVLVVGVGRGTKALKQFIDCTKDYEAQVLFGAATDTYDREGKILEIGDTAHLKRELVEDKLADFRGEIMQRPPIYSALQNKGKRMYEYAREGGEVPELPKRETRVDRLEMTEWLEPESHPYRFPAEKLNTEDAKGAKVILDKAVGMGASKKLKTNHGPEDSTVQSEESTTSNTRAKALPEDSEAVTSPTASQNGAKTDDAIMSSAMTVRSGFYVRSLCFDLGQACGSQAFMAGLIRTRQGRFTLGENVLEYTDLEAGEDVWGPKVKRMLRTWMLDEGYIGDVEGEEDAEDQVWMAAYDESVTSVGRRARRDRQEEDELKKGTEV